MRVTDEQARILADADPTVHIQIGLGRGVDVCLIAADLLDARSALRAVCEAAVAYVHHGFDDSDEERDLDAAIAAARKQMGEK